MTNFKCGNTSQNWGSINISQTSLDEDFQKQTFVFQYPYLGFALFPVEQKVRRDFQETYLIVVQTNKPTCNACWMTIGNRFLYYALAFLKEDLTTPCKGIFPSTSIGSIVKRCHSQKRE